MTPDAALLARARSLEADAIRAGEETSSGRKLRADAAALRVQALGERPYPVVVCSTCFRLTGWLAADGRCDECLRRAQVEAAYRDPHGGFVSMADARPAPRPAAPRRLPLFGRKRAQVAAWMLRVEPGETGPVAPEEGYELEAARRDELAAVDGSGLLIRFRTATSRFAGGGWVELEATRIGERDLGVPAELSAGLPAEQLAEAWGDFRGAVEAFNRGRWTAQSADRETRRAADAARADALRMERGAVDLLDEA